MRHFSSHRKSPVTGLLLGLAFVMASSAGAQPAGVAVFDIEAAASSLGLHQQAAQELDQFKAELLKELGRAQADLQAEFDKMRAVVGTNPSEEQAKHLQEIETQLNQNLAEKQQEVETKFAARNNELVTSVREQIRPVVQTIAKERGISLIVTPDNTLFHWDESIDITADVIAAMQDSVAGTPSQETGSPEVNRAPPLK